MKNKCKNSRIAAHIQQKALWETPVFVLYFYSSSFNKVEGFFFYSHKFFYAEYAWENYVYIKVDI